MRYRKTQPASRRHGPSRIETRRRTRLGPVLKFAAEGATVFDYDKAVVVVGEAIANPVREVLAAVIAEWQGAGGDVSLIVMGEVQTFGLAGCRGILQLLTPSNAEVGGESAEPMRSTLHYSRPWVDVVIALDAPDWACEVLADHLAGITGGWRPWIVATPGARHLTANLILEGELVAELSEAHLRAKAARPIVL